MKGIPKESVDASKMTGFAVLGSMLLVMMVLLVITPTASAQTYPTVTLTIKRIQEIDPIDGFGGDWDWYYWVGVADGTWSWTMYEAPDGQDVTFNQQHTFSVSKQSFTFAIFLCEDDFWTDDDYADISSDALGGGDDVDCDPTTVGLPWGSYYGVWNIPSGTLSGDTVVSDPQGWRTSGDFDGSTGVDENDANLWFTITDNYSPPSADAGPNKQGYIGDSISFDGSGSIASPGSSIEEYAWDFNNDGVYDQTGSIVSTTFSTKGPHTVVLRVTDSIGVQDTDTTTVTILNKDPVASFTFAPPSPSTQDTVDFIDQSYDPDPGDTIASWFWDFGDGSTSTAWNPSHQYSDDGSYSVSLTVTDNDGATDTETKTVTVTNVAPVAGFSFTPPTPSTVDTVVFTDTSVDLDGSVTIWSWDFGDGTLSTLQSPSHQYDDDGTYGVSLTVTDDDGATDTVSMDVVVSNEPPTADFTVSPTQAFVNEQVDFTDQSSDSDGTITSWQWDFGDGGSSIDQNPTHAYSSAGTYTVTLTVTDDDGDTDTYSDSVTIVVQGGGNIPPSADFSYTPLDPYAGQDVVFTDESTDADGSISSWSWDFGDGTTSTDMNPTHRYSAPGTYTVTLTVEDNEGETDSDTASITVDETPQGVNVNPIALFTCNPEAPRVGESIQFTDSSTDPDGTIEEWEWDFGDGTSSTAKNPSHSYGQSGEYTISLTVIDDDGLTDTSTMTITVTGESGRGSGLVSLYPWLILMLVIAIVVIVIFALVLRRKPE